MRPAKHKLRDAADQKQQPGDERRNPRGGMIVLSVVFQTEHQAKHCKIDRADGQRLKCKCHFGLPFSRKAVDTLS